MSAHARGLELSVVHIVRPGHRDGRAMIVGGLLGRAELGTVPGRVERDQHAARYVRLHVRPHLGWGDHVLRALQHQRRDLDLREVGAVVGEEGGAGEHLGDVRVHLAEAVRQLLAQLRPLGIAHDHRRHARRPAQVVVAQRLEELLDVRRAEPAAVVAVVDVARRRGDQHELGEPLRLPSGREHDDHGADRVPDERHVAQIELRQISSHVGGVAVARSSSMSARLNPPR